MTPETIRKVNYAFGIGFIILCTALGVSTGIESGSFESPLAIALGLALCTYGFFSKEWWINGRLPRLKYVVPLLLVYIPVAMIMFGLFYYGLWIFVRYAYSAIRDALPSPVFAYGLTVVATLGVGVLLFLFRLKARFFYGLTEAAAGVVVAIQKVPPGTNDPATWDSAIYLALLTAGIYLVVRGLDNMRAGLQPETYDLILKAYKEYEADYLARLERRRSRKD